MQKTPKFHVSFLGFSKKDVNDYIAELVRETELLRINKDADLAKLEETIKTLNAENATLQSRVSVMESEKNSVSNAMIIAEQEAQRIRQNAKVDGEKIIKDLQEQTLAQQQELIRVKAEIRDLRRVAVAKMQEFQLDLDKLSSEKK